MRVRGCQRVDDFMGDHTSECLAELPPLPLRRETAGGGIEADAAHHVPKENVDGAFR